ncbi:hypothetical protein C9426_11880 [Serratia sp. S1B]|nr:hypothetical protein C9426_11880 [Serratia sp. S1B]
MNKVYKVIWNAVLRIFVVASELAKNKQKKSSSGNSLLPDNPQRLHSLNNKKTKLFKISAIAVTLMGVFTPFSPVYAITEQQCIDMGTACALISSRGDLVTALSATGTATTLLLTQDVAYGAAGTVDVFQNQSNRQNIVIDGGGHSLTFGIMAFQTTAARTNNPNWAGQNASLTFTNFSSINTTRTLTQDARLVSAQEAAINLTVIMENNGLLLNNKLVAFGPDTPSGAPNNNSILRLGNNGPSVLNLGTFRQLGVTSKVELTGELALTIVPGSFPAVFWSNGNAANSTIHFANTADVSFLSSVAGNANVRLTNGPANSTSPDNATYNFIIDDGAKVNLNITGQNVLGISNFGVQVGSYDPLTGFGPGAVLILNNWSNTATVINNQLSNLSSTNATAAIFNGPTSPNDVIYNLAPESVIVAVNDARVSGIIAQKTTGTGNIYIRSGALISDGTGNVSLGTGITAETTAATATGNILVKNEGTILKATGILQRISSTVGTGKVINQGVITSTIAGINLLSNIPDRIAMSIDNTNGVINANSGSAINIGSANIDLDLIGGELNVNGTDPAINVNTDNTGIHTITGVNFNITNNATAITSGSLSTFDLYDNTFSITDGTLFQEISGLNFLYGTRNNIINISGAGRGIFKSFNGIDLTNAYLTINANGAGSIGLSTAGNQDGDANIIVGANTIINATAGSAIDFQNAISQSLINDGEINGSVSMGNSGNTIINNGTLYSLDSGSGDDTLTFNPNSISQGLIDLGAGNNTVNIYDNVHVNSVNTASGDDVFNIFNLTSTSNTILGELNAGAGSNTLNFINSNWALNLATRLENFNNINIDATSIITLADSNNISSGSQVNLTDLTSQLLFGNTYNGQFGAILAGTGSATVENGANVTLVNPSPFLGDWTINSGGILNASQEDQLGVGAVHLAGLLNLTTMSSFNKLLTGNGTLHVDANNNSFGFGANVGLGFTGLMDMNNGSFALTPANAQVLSNATLRGSANSLITVPTGNSQIGNLSLNGGTIQFADGGVITTNLLNVETGSVVQLDTATFTDGNLLDQDIGNITTLVNSSNTLSAGQLASLDLQDFSGNALSSGSLVDFLQNGNLVAINTYNFALLSDPGLKISSALTQIDLQAAQTLTLSSFGATDNTLSARVTGSGNLAIGSDNVAMTLSNTLNDYTGNTSVNGGILNVGANQALGNTHTLTVANGSTLNLSGYSQTVDSLVNDGTFNFAGGALTLLSGGSANSVGGLNGGGTLNINGGTFAVNATNSTFSAQTTIATGANATLNAADALGNSHIVVDGTLNLNAADTAFDNTLSGAGLVNINNNLVFTGNNQALSGVIDINANSQLTIDQTNQIGTADIDLTTGSSQLILDNLQGNLANTLSGVAGATVSVENGSNTTLIGTNTLFDGLFAIDGTSQLTVASDQPLGTSTIDIATGGQFIFNDYLSGALSALNNDITGTGTWLLNGSNIDLANNSHLSTFGGTVRINNGSSLTLDNQTALNANTHFDVVNGLDSLNIQGNAAFALANQLTGNGWVYVDNSGQSFDFTNNSNQFTGNLVLQNTQFVLNGLNTSTLTNANLTLDSGSNTTVGVAGVASNEAIGNLSLNGGTLNFYGDLLNESTITTDNLLASSGIINIAGGITWNDAGSSLLNQMANNASMALIYANIATGVDNLALHINGNAVTNQPVASDLIQNNLTVAQGLYNYALSNTRGADNGLFLNFNLIQLNLIEDGQNALLVATDATPGSNHNLSALVTGAGGIVLDASAAPLTISNSGNTYSGTTRATGGTVLLGASNALGQTQLLTVDNNALFDMAGFTQTVGALDNLGALTLNGGTLTNDGLLTNTGTLNLAGGTLNLLAGGTSTAANGLAGAGNLNVQGGSLTLSADNSTLTATTTIASGADVTLTDSGTLGSGDINIAGALNFNRDGSFGNRLRGNGVANTNANVRLTGNSDFTGTQSVNAGGTLTVTQAHNLGADSATVNLTTDTSTLVFDGLTGSVAQTLEGVAGSTVSIDNSADMSLTGDNTNFNGLFAIDGDSQLTVGLQQNLGNGAVDIASGSTLQFLNYAGTVPSILANTLTGSGTWWLNNSNIDLSGNTTRLSGFEGLIDINGNARLTLDELTNLNAATRFNVQGAGDNLDITTSGLFNFNYALSGSGTVNVNTAGQAFSFGSAVGNTFSGDVHLNSSTFTLAGTNTTALTDATLVLENGSTTTVGIAGTASNQTIGNLTLNGGTLQFYSDIPATSAESTLTTGTFTANSGIIDVVGPQSAPSTGGSLLNQIGNNAGTALIFSNNATNIDNLTLQLNGVAVNNQPVLSDLTQNGLTVAQALYNYALSNTRGADNGLFLNFDLIQLNLIEDTPNALVVATDANPGSNHDLSVLVTGVGGIVLDASAAPLTISNGSNTYSGSTQATGGTVLLGASNALGQTRLLTVDNTALFDMAGFTQTVGALDNLGALTLNGGTLTNDGLLTNTGTLNLAGGTLNLLGGGTSTAADGLAGGGNLNVQGGSLTLSADNSTLTATTTIASGADITLTNSGTLGTSDINIAGALNFNRDGSFGNQLSGDGVVNTNANVRLTGDNDFIGTQAVNAGGTLTVTDAHNLGADSATVNLTTNTSTLVFDGLTGSVAQTLEGVAGSTVSVDNTADLSLTGDNTNFNGLFAIDGDSTLTVGLQQNLGNGAVDIASGSTLQFLNFAGNVPSFLANTLTGSGTWWLNNSNINLAGNTTRLSGFDGLIDINGNARLTLDELTSLNALTRFNVQGAGDNLDITTAGLFDFNYALSGSGTVNVDTAGQAFSFGSAVGNTFSGDVHLNSSTFSLAGTNTAALTDATLVLENGNTTSVGIAGTASNQTIGNLTLNGGTLQFNSGTTATSAESTLTTGTFTANSGVIDILGPQSAPNTGGSLLNQIGNNAGAALIFSNNATNIDNLTLRLNGVDMTNQPLAFDLTQNGLTVAQGIYDYGLSNTRGVDNGLFLNFSLIQLNLIEDTPNALVVATDANPGSNHDLSVLVTGAGGIVLDASAAPLTISNGSNTYSGSTRATGGTVLLGASNALGQTRLLTVDNNALFDMAGFTQTVGALDNLGALTLNGGTLNLLDGGTSTAADGLAGAGSLNVLGGSLALSADNSTLTATTTIASGADVTLTNTGTLGSGDINIAGALNFNRDGSFGNQLSGDGVVNTNANVRLTGDSDFIGTQAVNAGGTLTVTDAHNLGADSATVNLTTDTSTLVFDGLTGIVAQTLQGIAGSTVSINNSADMSLTGDNTLFNGLFALDGNSQLAVGLQQNLGNGAVDIASGSTLQFLNFMGNVPSLLANTLTGSGTWWLNNSNINLSGNTTRLSGFDGLIDINGNARLTLDELTNLNADTQFNVQGAGDNLDIITSGLFNFNYALTGNGTVNVNTAGQAFSFGSAVGSLFGGDVHLNSSTFLLAGTNTTALTNATLVLENGSNTTVGITNVPSDEAIGNLTMNGGLLTFYGDFANTRASSILTLDTLQTNGGIVNLIGNGNISNVSDSLSILEQNRGNVGMQLISANVANGAGNLTLQLNGNTVGIGDSIFADIMQGGVHVANGGYEYELVNSNAANQQGLYLSFGLNTIELLTDYADALVVATDTNVNANTVLTARVFGGGGIVLDATNNPLTISNSSNTYSGTTRATGGTVLLGASNSLGQTRLLTVDNTALFNMAGFTQTVGALDNLGALTLNGGTLTNDGLLTNTGTLNLAGGILNLLGGGTSNAANGLAGAGNLNVQGGSLALSADNSTLTATTTIASGADVTLTNTGTLGSGDINIAGALNFNRDGSFGNRLSGDGVVNTNANVQLTSNNDFIGTQAVNADGTLTVTQAHNLGADSATVNLTTNTSTLVFDGLLGIVAQTLEGISGSTVNINNLANLSLTGDNTNFNGLFALDGDSQLTVGLQQNLGNGTVDIASGSTLHFLNFAGNVPSILANSLIGSGTWWLNNSNIDLSGNTTRMIGFDGLIDINGNARLTLDELTSLNAATQFNVQGAGDNLDITTAGLFDFNYALSGSGTVNVDTAGQAFSFGSAVGNTFSGDVHLNSSTFSLAGTNTAALTDATLVLENGSDTTVGISGTASNQTIGNLTLNGGTLQFYSEIPATSAESTLTTGTFTANSGIIDVVGPQSAPSTGGSLLNQIGNNAGTALIFSNNATNIDNLTLHLNGVAVNNQPVLSDLIQNSMTVAQGLYNYALSNTRGTDNGLFLNFDLIQLNLIEDTPNALVVATDANPGSNHDLSVLVTGVGGIVLDASAAPLTISNGGNIYSGSTRATGGTVLLGASNALGQTRLLAVDNTALLDMAGFTQTVGALDNLGALTLNGGTLTNDGLLTNTGTLNLAGGTLNLLGGGTSTAADGLAGAGNLNVQGGSLTLSADNSTLTATTTIASGADITLTNSGTLGTSDINIAGALNFNRDGSFDNQLSGDGVVNTNANVQLTGNNDFIGTQAVNAGGTLTVTDAHNLGADSATVNLTTDTSTLVFNGLLGIVAQTLEGVTNSTVNISNTADLSLTGNNTNFNGLFAIDGNSQLTVGLQQNLGNGAVDIASGSTLQFLNFMGNVPSLLANTLTGSGTWWLNNSDINLAGNTTRMVGFDGLIDINGNARLALDELTSLNAATRFNVQGAGDNLDITTAGLFDFNYALSGSGTVNVNTAGQAFSFGNAVGNTFSGDVHLNSSTFSLAGTNTAALTDATLVLENGSDTTVGIAGTASNQTIGNLTLNGGTLQFYSGIPATSAESTVTTGTLTANSGVIDIVGPQSAPNTGGSLLNQIGNNAGTALIFSNNATNIDNLTLQLNGVAVTNQPVASDLIQNSMTVAQAFYNYDLSNTRGTDNGLFLNFELIQLNLIEDTPNALVVATDANPGSNHDLSVLVTGAGGIVLDASAAPLTISNGGNTYGGSTQATGGTVLLGASNALGQTQLLTVDSNALLDMAGFTQTVGALDNLGALTLNGGTLTNDGLLTNTGTLNLAGGILNLLGGGTSTAANGLAGAGNLNVQGGSLALSADNSTLTATTNIASGADVTLTNTGTLGAGDINIAGALNFNRDGSFGNRLRGNGLVNTNANVQLTGNSDFTGTQSVNAGGTLTVTQTHNLGADSATVNLTTDTSTLVFDGLLGIVAQTLEGVANSTVNIDNTANLSLTGNNSNFNGLFALDGNSILTVGLQQNLGNGAVDIASGSQLVFNHFAGGALTLLDNSLSGAGNWVLNNSQIDLSGNGNVSNFSGLVDINTSSSVTIDQDTALNSAAIFNVANATDRLNINSNVDFTLNNVLRGSGAVNVNASGNAFNFNNSVGSDFNGTVTLQNTNFLLTGANTSTLTNATLALNSGSVTQVGVLNTPSTETIHALTMNGGMLNFFAGIPNVSADSIIQTQAFTAAGGVVNVTGDLSWTNNVPTIPPDLSLLDQNRGMAGMTLITANIASGANNLTLQLNGQPVAPGTGVTSVITQNGMNVAEGIYDYHLSNSSVTGAMGLYLNYELHTLNLLMDYPNALEIATSADAASNRTLTAWLTGVGGIVFNATAAALTVANSANDYHGTTTLSGGEVLLGDNNSFGQTSLLTVNSGAIFKTNGFNQTVGALDNAGLINLDPSVLTSGVMNNTGIIDLAGGTLILTNGGTSSSVGGLTGGGLLNVQGGNLSLTAANNTLSANTLIASGAAISLSNTGNLGTSAVEVVGALNFNGNGSFDNLLSGTGVINTNANVQLTHANTFRGTQSINANGTLTVTAANNLGDSSANIQLTDGTAQLIFSGLQDSVANTIQGVLNSTIIVNNNANMALLANNAGFDGHFLLTDNSVLNIPDYLSLGTATITIDYGSKLKLLLDNLTDAAPANLNTVESISGDGIITMSDSAISINTTDLTNFVGLINIDDGSRLNLSSDQLLNPLATLNVAQAIDTLNINSLSAFNFDNKLMGSGVINVNTNNTNFNFGPDVGTAFNGTLNLQNTPFLLGGNNTLAVTNAEVRISQGNITTVADGVQQIGSLVMNGGTLVYNNLVENNAVVTSAGTITANTINTTAGGTLRVNLPTILSPSLDGINTLDLDTGVTVVDLAKGAATGSGNELLLTNAAGVPIDSTYYQGITNPNSTTVAAMGSFRYGLSTGRQLDGLYVNYGLKVLELLTNGNDALTLTGTLANNGTPSNNLEVQIIGSGDLAIDSPNDGTIVTLNGQNSNYTGITWVRSGILQLESNNALGRTSNLSLTNGSSVNINGFTQTVGALNGEVGTTLNLGTGQLTVANGGNSSSLLTGSGDLILSAGTLILNTNTPVYSGTTTINSGATALLTQSEALGHGNIALAGNLMVNGATGNLANSLQGSGNASFNENARVILTGNNSAFNGTFTTNSNAMLTATNAQNFGSGSVINNSVLALDVLEDYWQLNTPISGPGTIIKQGHGTLQISNSIVSAATTVVEYGKLLIGTPPANAPAIQSLGSNATLTSNVIVQDNGILGGDGQIVGNVTNRGDILVGRSATGLNYSDFTINGNYIGENGHLFFDTVLGNDSSPTDRLVITGNTSGQSSVTVNNLGGQGAQNINGIQIIHVGGVSAGRFSLNGRAVSGALEYFLFQGTPSNPGDGNWYLRSNYTPPEPTPEPEVIYRPEAGSYIANIATANSLFNTRLDDIDTRVANDLTGQNTSLWLRQVGGRNKFNDASGQISSQTNRYVIQLGGEVYETHLTEKDHLGIGLMAGYGYASGSSQSNQTHYNSDQSLNGYSVGVYGTWYQDATQRHSPYLHAWLHYDWFDASIKGQELTNENYKIHGLSASAEGGYPVQIYDKGNNSGYITPELQLTINGAKMNNQTEANGTVIQQSGNNNLQTRVGVKFSNDTRMGGSKDQENILTTYLDINYINNSHLAGVSMDGMEMRQNGNRNLVEVRLGVEGKLNKNFSVWGNVGQQIGQNSYDDKSAMLGVRYKF